jgi:limonene 1,2-monooxygenase
MPVMRYGYFMMPLHPPGSDPSQTLEMDLKQIERLDELGFDEAWIGEHFTAEWENIPAPDVFIAAALQRTKRIKLGTGVACLPNHNPFMLAHRIAQLDHMARGRFLLVSARAASLPGRQYLDSWQPGNGRQQDSGAV